MSLLHIRLDRYIPLQELLARQPRVKGGRQIIVTPTMVDLSMGGGSWRGERTGTPPQALQIERNRVWCSENKERGARAPVTGQGKGIDPSRMWIAIGPL